MKVYKNPEILNELYWSKKLSLKQISKKLKVPYSTLHYWMKKNKIPRRKFISYKISKKTLRKLYKEKKLGTTEIAKMFGCCAETIRKKLMEFGISRRSNSESKTKYPKKDFSGDRLEKDYMIGLRVGDLYVRRNHGLVRIKTTTTHEELLNTLNKVYGKYGHFMTNKYFNKDLWEWRIECDLNNSFEFLLEKFERIPNWILKDDDCFYAFLTGYADADGSWIIMSNGKKGVRFIFSINSEDNGILEDIEHKLKELGYHPRFDLAHEKGTEFNYGRCNKDVYVLELLRKSEVKNLANISLHFTQHREKILKIKLILSGIEKWSEMSKELTKVKMQIKRTVLNK